MVTFGVGKHLTFARLSADGAMFVKAVRCYAAAVLSCAQAMRDFVTAKCIKIREPRSERAAARQLC